MGDRDSGPVRGRCEEHRPRGPSGSRLSTELRSRRSMPTPPSSKSIFFTSMNTRTGTPTTMTMTRIISVRVSGGHKFAVFKFSRHALQDAVPDGKATIRLEGSLRDARTFASENTNWTIHSDKGPWPRARALGRKDVAAWRQVDIPAGAFPGNRTW